MPRNPPLVIVGCCDGSIHAFNIETSLRAWKTDIAGEDTTCFITSEPVIHNDRVFVASQGDRPNFHVLDANTGKIISETHTGKVIRDMAHYGNKIYVHSQDGTLSIIPDSGGVIKKSDPTTKDEVCRTSGTQPHITSVNGDRVMFIGGDRGKMKAFELSPEDGRPIGKFWEADFEGTLRSHITSTNGVLVFSTVSHGTYGVNAETGETLWHFNRGTPSRRFDSSPVVDGEVTYTTDKDSNCGIYELDTSTGDTRFHICDLSPSRTAGSLTSLSTAEDTLLASIKFSDGSGQTTAISLNDFSIQWDVEHPSSRATANIAVHNNFFFIPLGSSEMVDDTSYLSCRSLENGKEIYTTTSNNIWRKEFPNNLKTTPTFYYPN
jgi:outer membrane protein assembly factor BamB